MATPVISNSSNPIRAAKRRREARRRTACGWRFWYRRTSRNNKDGIMIKRLKGGCCAVKAGNAQGSRAHDGHLFVRHFHRTDGILKKLHPLCEAELLCFYYVVPEVLNQNHTF